MLRLRFSATVKTGAIVDESGSFVGQHEGIHSFTIGQRKGLPAGAASRRWVKSISSETGQVTVTSNPDDLVGSNFLATNVNWLPGELPSTPLPCSVQVRYCHASEPATVCAEDGNLRISLAKPVKAITPGQAAVFYDGDRTLGRGWIADRG
jgi:tRNA-specific 2-thiouridylase